MANSARWRYGDQQRVKFAVASADVIERGDLVWLSTNTVKAADDFTWDTNLATTQGSFAALFVGVACESSADGEDDDIDVDISPLSVYEMDCASATFVPGAPVGPAKATGNALENQKVVGSAAAASVGRAVLAGTSVTKVYCSFASVYNPAANNVNGALG